MLLLLPSLAICQTDILSQQVSLRVEDTLLEEVLNRLSDEFSVEISYSDNHVPLRKNVSLSFDGSLGNALKLLLADSGVSFKLIGGQVVLIPESQFVRQTHVLSGYVRDSLNGEDLIGVSIKVKDADTGVITNNYGFYSLSLPEGSYEIVYSYLGFQQLSKKIDLTSDKELSIGLPQSALQLNELVIESDTEADVISSVEMNNAVLTVQRLKQMPALLGEVDIVQSLLLLPGVQSVGEGKTGLYVRGGSADQTLIQLDEATIFNAFHIGGLFSVFNPDVLKDVKLHKGGAPVQYGGRLSSVLDVRMKEGNKQKFSSSGGIGTISSRLSIEGPLSKTKGELKTNKGSFILSGRRTYLDLLLGLSGDSEVNGNKLFFYDLNGKINYSINKNNRIFASSYVGRDVFRLKDDVSLKWGNFITSLRWNHLFNSKLFLNTTFLYSNFNYGFSLEDNLFGINWESSLKNYSLKTDFYYYINPTLELDFGYSIIWHHFSPADIVPLENFAAFEPIEITTENALEQGLYTSLKKKVSDKLEVNLGLRFSLFQNYGPGEYYVYEDGSSKVNSNITDTLRASKYELINTSFGFEPRINARFLINSSTSVKGSYNRNKQYIHVLANNTVGFPTDRYKPSNPNLSPQTSDQFSLGIFKKIRNLTWSAEGYYRIMQDLAQINSDPNAIISNSLEQKLYTGKGWSYGLEMSLRKEKGKTTGWVSYTWSRTWHQLANLNGGKRFNPFYDRTHDVNVAVSHMLKPRISISTNWVFSSGQALSLPIGKYEVDGKSIPLFDDTNLNGDRGPAYHRLDLSFEIKGKNKKKRRWQGSWNIAFYNLYFRKNLIGFQYRDVINGDPEFSGSEKGLNIESREFRAVGSYLFQFIPSVTYNFKF
ncbi:MAG: TonB-dependent receptor [Reichenbachiella sp.]|uniref:TonB-dependent receptor n=2 Tax=Reichenbachiella sp. TaxID=2184521 RepID=UPI00326385D0